jgi:hypothetical protein
MKVPFVDLRTQHHTLRPELEKAMQGVMERGDFALDRTYPHSRTSLQPTAVRSMRWESIAACPPWS